MVDREEMQGRMQGNAEENGYFLCPEAELLEELLDGLIKNEGRYGYASCPCRISSGYKAYDADIVCPCEYRDADVDEFGMCYCGLFVDKKVHEDPSRLQPIAERRPKEIVDEALKVKMGKVKPVDEQSSSNAIKGETASEIPVWRCKVCGYLAAREHPPAVCPICKAKKDRFERFSFG